ncbi:hypothetical protein C8B47_21850 [filamentous cyanobacterium CCP4]|nr:hypothetical protein C8B47_21850 [filamentous cyanobacterium CCP4]
MHAVAFAAKLKAQNIELFIVVPGLVKYRLIFESLVKQVLCLGLLYFFRQRTVIYLAIEVEKCFLVLRDYVISAFYLHLLFI